MLADAPQLEQRGREEWKDAGPDPGIGDERIRQWGLDLQADGVSRSLDHGTELLLRQRPDDDLGRASRRASSGNADARP